MQYLIFLILMFFNLVINGAEGKLADINFEANNVLYRIEPKLAFDKYYTFELYNKEKKRIGYLNSRLDSKEYSFIGYVFICDDLQGKGYGELLLKQVCLYLKENGVKAIRLLPYPSELKEGSVEFNVRMERLNKFYKKCGFVKKEDSDLMEMKF